MDLDSLANVLDTVLKYLPQNSPLLLAIAGGLAVVATALHAYAKWKKSSKPAEPAKPLDTTPPKQ